MASYWVLGTGYWVLGTSYCPSLRRVLRPLRQRPQKIIRTRRRLNLSRQRSLERHHAPIKFPRAVFILLDLRAVQVAPAKSPRARE